MISKRTKIRALLFAPHYRRIGHPHAGRHQAPRSQPYSRGAFSFARAHPGASRNSLLAIARAVEVRAQGGRMLSQGLLDAPVRTTARVKPRIVPTVEHIDQAMTVRIENPLEMSWRKGKSETISCIMRLVSSSIFFTGSSITCSTTRTISRPKGVEAISDTDESMVNGAMGVRAGRGPA